MIIEEVKVKEEVIENGKISESKVDIKSPEKIKNPELLYDLLAVSNHMGGTTGGHYTAYCKNNKSNKWYTFNDSSVHEMQANEVCTENAYVLFYQRKKNVVGKDKV